MRQSEFTSRATFVSKGGRRTIFIAVAALMAMVSAFGQDTTTNNSPLSELADMDITNLFNIKVSIVSPNAPETIPQTPAAVSVVSAKEIERSGAQNYPQALRLIPGMNVAQVDSSQWAVSSRGFNDVFANKLLVMQDGRSIYTPLFSGVFWDVQGSLLADIDQIEVVRGPGATIWGANAMNGVINIITKSAADTQGLLVNGGGGAEERGFAGARYGGSINSNAFYRVYATYENHDSTVLPDGSDANNSWQLARTGFRTDWNPTDQNSFTFQGDGYAGWMNQVFDEFNLGAPGFTTTNAELMKVSGANALGRWTHTLSDTSNFKLQMYYDYTARFADNLFDEQRHTFDLDFKHEFALGTRNNIVWGLGYRITDDREGDNPTISFYTDSQAVNLYSAFVQDELTIVPDRLSLTVGSKFEQNDYTGFDFQPSARLLWTPTEHQTFWASVSRSVRTPSRSEQSVILTQAAEVGPGIYLPATILGTNTFKNENMLAYEVGYRSEPLKNLSFDAAAYWNHYNDLRSEVQIPTAFPPMFYLANNIHGNAYGCEISATWRVLDWWRLQPSYSYLKTLLHVNAADGYTDTYSVGLDEGSSPENQFMIRSSMDLPHNVTFDTALRFVDKLEFPQPSPAAPTMTVPDYFELDARLAWRINKNWEVAVIGQNMLHDRHVEFEPTYVHTQATEIPRSVFAQVTYQF
jgi:iron complex outermembrane receptor protein